MNPAFIRGPAFNRENTVMVLLFSCSRGRMGTMNLQI